MANRARSVAWEFFSKTGNANLAKCHICCSVLAYSGTTNLLKHLRAKHSEETADVLGWTTDDGEERTELDAAVEGTKQTRAAEELNESHVTVMTPSPDQRSGRKNRSMAWNCFKKIVGSNVAECLFCGVQISHGHGTTTSLMKHFMVKHPDVYAMHLEGSTDVVPSPSNDDDDPDYTPNGKRSSAGNGRKKLNVLGKRIKVELDNDLDSFLNVTDDSSTSGVASSSFRNRSLVWQVFVKEPDSEYVKCTICGTRLKLMSGSTTTMLNHYISKHTEEYQEALAQRVQAANSRSSLVKVHFDQLSASDFWCCLCSRIMRQPQGSTSNLHKHLQARHPKEFNSLRHVVSDDEFVKVEDSDALKVGCSKKEMQTVEQIWQRHCRERERDHYQQIATMRSRLGTMKTQMSKLRKEMSDLEAEIRITEKNRLKEIAREKELTEQFGHSATKDGCHESQTSATLGDVGPENGYDDEQGIGEPITEAVELLNDDAVVDAVGSSLLMDIDSGRWTQNC